jgi:hypothetical protein
MPLEGDFPEAILRAFYEQSFLGAPLLDGVHPVGDQAAGGLASSPSLRKRDVGIGAETHALLFPSKSKLQAPQTPASGRDLEVHAPAI